MDSHITLKNNLKTVKQLPHLLNIFEVCRDWYIVNPGLHFTVKEFNPLVPNMKHQ